MTYIVTTKINTTWQWNSFKKSLKIPKG